MCPPAEGGLRHGYRTRGAFSRPHRPKSKTAPPVEGGAVSSFGASDWSPHLRRCLSVRSKPCEPAERNEQRQPPGTPRLNSRLATRLAGPPRPVICAPESAARASLRQFVAPFSCIEPTIPRAEGKRMPAFTIHLDDDITALIRRRAEVLGVSPEWVVELAATAIASRRAEDVAYPARSGRPPKNRDTSKASRSGTP